LFGVIAKLTYHLDHDFLLMIAFGNGLLAAIERCGDFRGQHVDGAFERRFVDGRRRIVRRIGVDTRMDGVCIRQVIRRRFLVVTANGFDRCWFCLMVNA
jgi:hypothetical protein